MNESIREQGLGRDYLEKGKEVSGRIFLNLFIKNFRKG